MINLKIVKTVLCEFTPDQWELYFENGRYDVANALNKNLELLINGGKSKSEVMLAMHEFMKSYRKYGACDTEPMRFLGYVLDEVYS